MSESHQKSSNGWTALGAVATVLGVIVAVVLGISAHQDASSQSTRPLEGTASPPPSDAPSEGASSTSGAGSSTPSSSMPMPTGPAFARGDVLIGIPGIDLDRDPPSSIDVLGRSELETYGNEAIATTQTRAIAKWEGTSAPSQQDCHRAEESRNLDQYSVPWEGAGNNPVVSICLLTSEGRDAFVSLRLGEADRDSLTTPASVFVWPVKIS